MIAVVTVLLAFPLGYLLRSHLAANVAYAIAYLWAFTYQTLYLTLSWVGGDESAFAKDRVPALVRAGRRRHLRRRLRARRPRAPSRGSTDGAGPELTGRPPWWACA